MDSFRHFDTTQLNEWRNDRAFRYQKSIVPQLTWWDRFKMWLLEKWFEIMSTRGGRTTFWTVVIILSILIIVFFTYRYMGKTSGIWSKSDKNNINLESIEEENIHEINFEEKIAQALSDNNYRLAVRLRYLYILKILDDRESIKWQSGKTNHDYILEVRSNMNEDGYALFRQISIAFDFAWYGEHDATLDDYNSVKTLFDQLKSNSFTATKQLKDERI